MRAVKFNKFQKSNALSMCRNLFPEFKYIFIRDECLVFSNNNRFKENMVGIFNVKTDIKIPIFELFMTEVPKRLSLLKANNLSFVSLYIAHLSYLINIDKASIVNYLYNVYVKSPNKSFEKNTNAYIDSLINRAMDYEDNKYMPEIEFHKMKSQIDALNLTENVSIDKYRELVRDFESLIKF